MYQCIKGVKCIKEVKLLCPNDEWEKRHMAGILDGLGELALVLTANASPGTP